MEVKVYSQSMLFLCALIFCCGYLFAYYELSAAKNEEEIKRSDFPAGFLFGAATSAYQIEGGYLEDGKSLSNWDAFCHINGSIQNGDDGFVSVDHYHRYLEDIQILHSLGVDAYRFSISWPRLLPNGRFGEVNPTGIMFYNDIIDNLLARGIVPFVTIHHHDYPQELEDKYGAWLSPLMQEDFVYFAEICFKSFGDRVKHWSTINEPNLFVEMAYGRGVYPPAHCSEPFGNCPFGNSDVEPLIAMHNMLLAHGKVSKLYKDRFKSEQGGVVGTVIHMFMYEPLSDDKLDQEAAIRALAFNVGWGLDPLIFGDYPPEMRQYLGSELPQFSSEEIKYLNGSLDFIGVNHYSSIYTKDCTKSHCPLGGDHAIKGFTYTTGERDGVPIGNRTGMDRFFVVPEGMEKIINYVKNRYHNMPMYVTENGYPSPQHQELHDTMQDLDRIDFHKAYLTSLGKAVRNGADVRGYFVWTLMDDFEWDHGYNIKLGLYYVDPNTLDRIPKLSSDWYKRFLSNDGLDDKRSNLSKFILNKIQKYTKICSS